MKIHVRIPSDFFDHAAAWVKKHINAMLFLFFLCAMALAGFIFWRYGYQAAFREPEITVRTIAPKENELRALIEKAETKEKSQALIFERSAHDPFIQPEKQQ